MSARNVPFQSVAEARRRARRRLPYPVFDYVERGSDAERTAHENVRAFDEVTFLPRIAESAGSIDTRVRVLGSDLSLPVILAPAGFLRLVHPDAERAVARASARVGTAMVLSTLASTAVADVTRCATDVWYQLYFSSGHADAELAIARAHGAGCSTLVVTLDVATAAPPDRARRPSWVPRRVDVSTAARFAPEAMVRPRWTIDFLRGGTRLVVPNVHTAGSSEPMPVADAAAGTAAHMPSWADVSWARERWAGALVVKGVLSAADARRAAAEGADAVVVSNHGGRSLDGVPATLRVLPDVVAAVGSEVEVLLDGGVRRGSDVVRAVALGATAVLVGRPYIWGLAAAGEEGVVRVIDLLRLGVRRTLQAIGRESIAAVDATCVTVT